MKYNCFLKIKIFLFYLFLIKCNSVKKEKQNNTPTSFPYNKLYNIPTCQNYNNCNNNIPTPIKKCTNMVSSIPTCQNPGLSVKTAGFEITASPPS